MTEPKIFNIDQQNEHRLIREGLQKAADELYQQYLDSCVEMIKDYQDISEGLVYLEGSLFKFLDQERPGESIRQIIQRNYDKSFTKDIIAKIRAYQQLHTKNDHSQTA